MRKCLPLYGGGDYFGGHGIGLDVCDLRRRDAAGIVNNTLRPFLVGMNVNGGRTSISPIRPRMLLSRGVP